MTSQRTSLFFAALAALTITLGTPVSHAQQGPRDSTANSLVRQAMQEYQDLEIDAALSRLQRAVTACGASGCSNAALSRVHMSMGIVYVGGQQNTQEGVAAMARALQLDSHAEPDTLLATPEITAAFEQARRQGGSGSTGTGNTTGRNPPPAASSGEFLHTPATEQIENTPLPVYVEPASPLSAAHVYVYFRGNGMRQYQRQELRQMGQGWGVEIPCVQIMQPAMDYYIAALDSVGTTIANTGSEDSPVRVTILASSARRTVPAPSLPGQRPPQSCASCEDCPPGMTGPQCCGSAAAASSSSGGRAGGLGDPCGSNPECGEGLRCDGGACGVDDGSGGGGGSTEEPGATRPSRVFSRFSFDLGGGVGGAFLSGTPSYAEQFTNRRTGQPECGSFTCYRTIDPGLAPTFWLNANFRYNVTQRVGIAVGVRFQFDTAPWTIVAPGTTTTKENPLANLLLYGRVYYAFTPAGFAPTGMVGAVFFGAGGGQIEPKPGVPASARNPSAHVLSGFGNAHVGGRVEYGLRNGFHVAGELTLHFMFPTFLFNADVAALVGFHF